MKKKLLLGIIVLASMTSFFLFDFEDFFTLENLNQLKPSLMASYWLYGWQVLAAFFLIYVLLASLFLPGTTILCLAAGALFGFKTAFLLVSFAGAIGATFAFLIARSLLRNPASPPIYASPALNTKLENDGAYSLFFLRLTPFLPFALVNALMGFTAIRPLTFFGVTQLAMIPSILITLHAGTQLEHLSRLADIFSWKLTMTLMFVGLIPLLSKKALSFLKGKRSQAAMPTFRTESAR